MEITGIDLESHLNSPDTLTYTQGREKLLKTLEKHKIKGKRKHFVPLGQNLQFDLGFVHAQLVDKDTWEKMIHYNYLDTLRIVTFLKDIGMIASDIGNLTSLVEYFGIPKGTAHNAKEDVRMTVDVYKALRNMLEERKDNFSGVNNNSLLEIIER
jgi:DNA polymerase III epsilon subunit-like protein